MPGITKINAIDNLGIFEGFNWPLSPENLQFQKINLVYGYNGSGKTTLTNILNLFSDEILDENKIELLAALKTIPHKLESINIEWDGSLLKSFNEKKKIHVFNSAFVADHVYDGSLNKLKPFKSSVTTKEQLSNPEIKSATDEIEQSSLYISQLEAEKKTLEGLAETNTKNSLFTMEPRN